MTVTPQVAALVLASTRAHARVVDEHTARLLTAWQGLWEELEPEFQAVLDRAMADATVRGTRRGSAARVRPSDLARSKRLAAALAQARDRTEQILAAFGQEVAGEIPDAIRAVVAAHTEAMRVQLPAHGLGVDFDTVNPAALDAITSRTLERITAAHRPLPTEVEAAMRRELMRGVAVGDNPREIARRIINRTGTAFKGGYQRAEMIARTEMLDAQRSAEQANEKANADVLAGWTWVCALDSRSCASCVAMHGTEWPTSEPGPLDHHRGRCTRAPRTKTWADLGFPGLEDTAPPVQTGPDWWAEQSRETQDAVLGKTRADLVRSGRVSWDQLTQRVRTPGWRDAYHQTPISTLLEES